MKNEFYKNSEGIIIIYLEKIKTKSEKTNGERSSKRT